jgi:hypothetical protein
MGKDTSRQLVVELNNEDINLRRRTQAFAELASSVSLPIHCFFETEKTEMLRRLLSRGPATQLSAALGRKTHKIVRSSPCMYDLKLTTGSLSPKIRPVLTRLNEKDSMSPIHA